MSKNTWRNKWKNLYRDVVAQRVSLGRRIFQGALSPAALLLERLARTVMKGLGFMAVTRGEVAHIIKCVPIDCKLRRTGKCVQELPVTYHNESYFLSATSRMLMKSATQINWHLVVPAQYQIEGTWYRFSLRPIEVLVPQSLEPLSKHNWEYASSGNLATTGIYSEYDIDNLRERIMFLAGKPALLNNIARKITSYQVPAGSVSLLDFLDKKSLNHIAENTATKI